MKKPAKKINSKQQYMDVLEKSINSIINFNSKTFAQATHERYEFFKSYSPMGNTASEGFIQIFSNSLVKYGVDIKRLRFEIKSVKSNVKVDVLVLPKKGSKKSFALMLKTSLKERWKIDDRDAFMILHNAKNCWTEISTKHGLRSDITPDIWLLTFKDDPILNPNKAIKMAREKGEMAGGIQGDRIISIYDEEGMDRLLREIS